MIFSSSSLSIRTDNEFGENSLYFQFNGKFTEQDSIDGTRAWASFLDSHPGDFVFVWDCSNMSGFEIAARLKWYENMKIYTGRIEYIHMISGNILIRGAGRVMLEYFGIKGTIAKSFDALKKTI